MMHKLLSTLSLLLMLGAMVPGARAQIAESAPTAEQTRLAREAYARGQKLFREGDYAGAQEAFETAYRHVPNPVVLLGIAESQQRQGLWAEAETTLLRYLDERPNAPDRPQVEQQLADIRRRPASVWIESTPPGAAIWVDGTDTGLVTPATVEMPAGDHLVLLRSADGIESEQALTAVVGAEQGLDVELAPPVPTPEVPEAEPGAPEEITGGSADWEGSPKRVRTAAWASLGVGAAGLVVGSVLGGLALKEQHDFNANPTNATADRGEKLAIFADLGFGIAVAGVLTSVVLFTSARRREDERSAQQARLRVLPEVSRRGAGLGAALRF